MYYKIGCCILLFLFLSACKNNPSEDFVEQKINQDFIISDTLYPLCDTMGIVSIDMFDKPIKIVHFFDGDCGYCIYNLENWESYMNSLSYIQDIDYIFFTQTESRRYLQAIIQEKFNHIGTVFYIRKNEFLKTNNIPDNPQLCTYLIIDKKIKAVGDPVNNPEIKILYEEQILGFFEE